MTTFGARQKNLLEVKENHSSLLLEFASNIALLPRLTGLCTAFLQRLELGTCPHASLIVRELVSNAITHGNSNNYTKNVRCEITHLGDRDIRITVEDAGTGFDHHTLNLSLPEDPRRLRQRGLVLVNAVAEAVEFNEAGNVVTIWLKV